MAVSIADITKLRKMTGAGMIDCKNALAEAEGNFETAIELIRKRGQAIAAKREDRDASEGCVLAAAKDDVLAFRAESKTPFSAELYYEREPDDKLEYLHLNYDTDGYITISVSVMDLSGMVSGKFEQLGFLLGVQQQMAYMVLDAMSGIQIRVKENTLDSENNMFTYRYSYSELGFDIEGIILYSFSGSKCIAYTAEWDAGHAKASDIIDAYETQLI